MLIVCKSDKAGSNPSDRSQSRASKALGGPATYQAQGSNTINSTFQKYVKVRSALSDSYLFATTYDLSTLRYYVSHWLGRMASPEFE